MASEGNGGTAPPRLARRILKLLVGSEDVEQVESGLAELHRVRVAREGAGPASRWYWRQLLGFVWRARSLRREARLRREALAPTDRDFTAVTQSVRLVDPEAWLRTVRRAVRSLARQPAFALVAVVTLALGIGANTAIFSVLRAVVLRPLQYADAASLVAVWPETVSNVRMTEWLAANTRSFESITGFTSYEFTLTGDGQAERIAGARVSPAHFDVLGVRPVLGRSFVGAESEPARSRVVVLSHALWRARYGGDPSVVGRTVDVDYQPHLVIGVLPPSFRPLEPEHRLWVPQPVESGTTVGSDETWWVRSRVARLAPGVTVEAAQQELRLAAVRLADQFPAAVDRAQAGRATVVPLQVAIVGEFGRTLWILLAAVGLVLLIACSNVANLLLARAGTKQREVAIRTAIGASRGQVVWQLLTESIVLGVAGGAAGVALSHGLLRVLALAAPPDLPRIDEVAVDGTVLAFAVVLSLAAPIVFGLVPAYRATRLEVREVLSTGGRGFVGGARRSRLASALIAAEVALSVVLVVAAGLMVKTVQALESVDTGFRPDGVLTLHVAMPPAADQPPNVAYRRIWEALAALPGVVAVGGIHILPLTPGNNRYPFWAQDNEAPAGSPAPTANIRVATPGYLDAMGLAIRAGRWFTPADGSDSRPVMIVNESLARRLWPGESPLGKTIRLLEPTSFEWEVVGVVADARQMGLARDPSGEIYLPHEQWAWPTMFATIRTAADPASLIPAVRRTIHALDDDITLSRIATMDQVLAASIASNRFLARLTTAFGLLALSLAVIGVYGVVAYVVGRRIPEFGIRIALGSSARAVVAGAMAYGLLPVATGVALGLAAAWATTRVLATMLFGVAPTDPPTFAAAAAVLLAVAAAASYLPARRASAVDPTIALRGE